MAPTEELSQFIIMHEEKISEYVVTKWTLSKKIYRQDQKNNFPYHPPEKKERSISYLWMIAQLFESCYVGQYLWLLHFFSNCPLNLCLRTLIYQFSFDNLLFINIQQRKTPYEKYVSTIKNGHYIFGLYKMFI